MSRLAHLHRSRAFSLVIAIVCAVLIPLPLSWAQTASAPRPSQGSKPAESAPAKIVEPPPSPEAAPQAEPPLPRTPAQMPPNAPEVLWDGKQLSIHAENSTLSDVLVLVRTRTGATIDIPSAAAKERIFASLGPAPVREVLTSLLYGSDFDYIIQASDTNQDSIRSVVLTPRGGGNENDVVASAGSAGSPTGSPSGSVRTMKGYSPSGKPTFVTQFAPKADESANAEPAAETAAANPETASGSAESASTAPSTPTASSGDPNAVAENNAPSASPSELSSSGSATSDSDGNPTTQMIQNMQRMFEQRRQIQAQQNQQNQTQPSPTN